MNPETDTQNKLKNIHTIIKSIELFLKNSRGNLSTNSGKAKFERQNLTEFMLLILFVKKLIHVRKVDIMVFKILIIVNQQRFEKYEFYRK